MRKFFLIAGAVVLGACGLRADEMVFLKTGFSLQAQSHTVTERGLSFLIGTGRVELAPEEIEKIEPCADLPTSRPAAPIQVATEDPETVLNNAALAEGLEGSFLRSVAKAESGFAPQAVSPKGAVGLMQLMPATAASLGVDAARIEENARGGAKYLRELLLRYHNNSALALAAYNAGPGAVARYGGVPPYAETRQYIIRVTREYDRQIKAEAVRAKPSRTQGKSSVARRSAESASQTGPAANTTSATN